MNAVVTFESPVALGWSRSQVETFADRIRSAVGFEPAAHGVAGDIDVVVENLGGAIEYVDALAIGATADASIEIFAPDNFLICLPLHTGARRDRFSIAHELGHFFLHYYYHFRLFEKGGAKGNAKPIRALRTPMTSQVEFEADAFAAAFLMPRSEFKEFAIENKNDVTLLASHFGVSLFSADRRLTEIGAHGKTVNRGKAKTPQTT